MPKFYEPDLAANRDDPFARGEDGKLVRRGFWLDMGDQSVVLAMTQGVGARMRGEEKRLKVNSSAIDVTPIENEKLTRNMR